MYKNLAAIAMAADWFSWRAQGIDPELTSQGAMSHAMLALQAQLVAVVVLMAVYLAARTARGLVTRPANTTFDVVALFTLYTAAQGAAIALLIRWERAKQQWNDQKSREIEEDFIAPLKPKVRSTLASLSRVGTIVGQAKRECE